jgi:hypothetical protein
MLKRIMLNFVLCMFVVLPSVYAKHIEVTAEMVNNILSIEIAEVPGHQMTDEQKIAENNVIQRLTSGEVVIEPSSRQEDQSKQKRLKVNEVYNKLKTNYDIEEVTKDGQAYWKCILKNPKTIIVEKSRYVEYKDSQGNTIHSKEHYTEEEPNPNYIDNEKALEDKTIWYKVEKKK